MLQYLLKFSISLAALYVFYKAVLRPLTFYQWNRFYLLCYSLLSFVIPFINISPWVAQQSHQQLVNIIPAIDNYTAVTSAPPVVVPSLLQMLTLSDLLLLLFVAGATVVLVRLLLQYCSLRRIRRQAVLLSADAPVHLYETKVPVSPFSFGNAVYFNRQLHTEEELQRIIQHEFVHVKQKHTVDLLVAECLCVVNWFNPFAWFIRHSIRQNLEFIADEKVVANGLNKKEYQYLLLKVVGIPQYSIAGNFNVSNLKKRITMMNKMKSARLHLGRFLFVLPLLCVLLLAFRNNYSLHPPKTNGPFYKNTAGIVLDIITKDPLAGVQVTDTVSGLSVVTDKRGFFKMQIPVNKPAAQIQFVVTKDGYRSSRSMDENNAKPVTKNSGLIKIFGLLADKDNGRAPLVFSPFLSFEEPVTDPGYTDAVLYYKKYLTSLQDLALTVSLRNNNPAVADFYATEDKKGQLVIFKNGTVEKYGYEGTPSIAMMEQKYGQLPSFAKENDVEHTDYNNRWKQIAADLSARFVTRNKNIRQVIFPGDSRVLVQLPNGKVDIYDMDYQQEREKFEFLYGSLTGPLPRAERNDKDTLPAPPPPALGMPGLPPPPPPASSLPANVKGISIESTIDAEKGIREKTAIVRLKNGHKEVYDLNKPEEKAAYVKKYGELPEPPPAVAPVPAIRIDRSVRPAAPLPPPPMAPMPAPAVQAVPPLGVPVSPEAMPSGTDTIAIQQNAARLRLEPPAPPPAPFFSHGLVRLNANNPFPPLFIVDGKELPPGVDINTLDPNDIESITVWKDGKATLQYGDRGKNGVIDITTKNQAVQKRNAGNKNDSAVYNFNHMEVPGKMVTHGRESFIDGRFSFGKEKDMPLLIVDGNEITDITSFKAAEGQYRLWATGATEGMAQYGDKAKYGVLEITHLPAKNKKG